MFNSQKPAREGQGVYKSTIMLLSLLLLLCVSSFLKAQDTGSSESSQSLSEVCVTDDNCQEQTTECFDGSCVCRPGLFTTSDGSCLSTCSLTDLQNTFITYLDSNIRGLNNFGLSFESSVQKCMERCVQTNGCLTLDFRAYDGWCQLHNVTALTFPSHWRPKFRPNWTHYQRMCRSSMTSQLDHTYNTTCSSDSQCSSINGRCLMGRCQCAAGFLFAQAESSCRLVESCVDVQRLGGKSGVYTILVNQKSAMTVWCDMDSNEGGWLVFQRRVDGSVDFYRNWTQYEAGFGDVTGEFWLGLSWLHYLTTVHSSKLRVDLGEVNEEHHYAEYSSFRVGGPETNYRLTLSGYSGNAGDSLDFHNDMSFSTYDGDNDNAPDHCAEKWHGAWWFNACLTSDLNGRYKAGGAEGLDGVLWVYAHMDTMSFTFSEMKVKPV